MKGKMLASTCFTHELNLLSRVLYIVTSKKRIAKIILKNVLLRNLILILLRMEKQFVWLLKQIDKMFDSS